jgi:hypothetical protein
VRAALTGKLRVHRLRLQAARGLHKLRTPAMLAHS